MANLLTDRYRIEKMIGANGLSITYEALDTEENRRILLRELYPAALVERDKTDGLTIRCVRKSSEPRFRLMKEHVIKEAETMIGLYPITGVAGILSYFEENGTVYTVADLPQGIPLPEYMKKLHMPKILLHDAFKMLMPVIDGLELLHAHGVVHGRIDPELIFMDERGQAVLTGFGEPMEDATAEIFQDATARSVDYAPVEQFIEGGHYDTSVDVYAIAAVLYELVCGKKVPTFYERLGGGKDEGQEDPLVEPKIYNGKIMDYQNRAMLKALSIYYFDRYTSMHEFGEAISEKEFADDYRILVQHKKPAGFVARVRYNRLLRWGFALCLVFFLVFFGPRLFRIGTGFGAGAFYEKLIASRDYEMCRLVADLSEGKRARYANDYNRMKEDGDHSIYYYDILSDRFVTYDHLDLSADYVRYAKLDYRLNNTAILDVVIDGNSAHYVIDLKPYKDGSFKITKSFTGETDEKAGTYYVTKEP